MMKNRYKKLFSLAMLVGTSSALTAQTRSSFDSQFETVKSEMVSWDQVRGEWLANSMKAMISNSAIPDRYFPEDYTPIQMFEALPEKTQINVRNAISTNSAPSNTDSTSRSQWTRLNSFNRKPNCPGRMARTYGDPHISTFDGTNFSFQTVGEFRMVKSGSGNMEVQSRQQPQGEDFSLNTAVAMNVAGDRLCIYASTFPDANLQTPLRLEGQALYLSNKTYFLPNGGTIVPSRKNYIVTWPTGERVEITLSGSDFLNINVEVVPCSETYFGVLGNADGNRDNDYDAPSTTRPGGIWDQSVFNSTDNSTREMEMMYLNFLSQDFANVWRITQNESLFDYGFGQNTETFTDRFFPRRHVTLRDMDGPNRDRARTNCERTGLTGRELNECMFDNGFVNIAPTPVPTPTPPIRVPDGGLAPVRTPLPNVNPEPPIRKPIKEKPISIQDGVVGGTGGRIAPQTTPITEPVQGVGGTSGNGEPALPRGEEPTKPVVTPAPSKEPVEVRKPRRIWSSSPTISSPENEPTSAPAPARKEPIRVSTPAPERKEPVRVSTPAPERKVPVQVSTPAPARTPAPGRKP